MQAIILSRRDFRESDQLISIYTKNKGKLDLLARGVKKITSKNSAHLEPFCFGQVEVIPGKEIGHLIRVTPINFFPNIRQDFYKSLTATKVVHFTNRLIEVGEEDKEIFENLKTFLQFLDKLNLDKPENLLTEVDSYMVKLLNFLGLSPVLDRCVVCEKNYSQFIKEGIINQEKFGFYFSGGGLVCSDCRKQKESAGEEIFDCGLSEVSNLKEILEKSWHIIYKFEISDQERTALHKLVYEYAIFHSEKGLGDWGLVIAQ